MLAYKFQKTANGGPSFHHARRPGEDRRPGVALPGGLAGPFAGAVTGDCAAPELFRDRVPGRGRAMVLAREV